MSSRTVNLPNEFPDFLRRQRARRSPISKMNWPAHSDETAYARRSAAIATNFAKPPELVRREPPPATVL
jgi:hypothetical protein